MHKPARVLRLPPSLAKQPSLSQISRFLEAARTLYSSVVRVDGSGAAHLIHKDEQTPYLEPDWRMYCILRSWARTLLTTGAVLRGEKTTFLSRATYGDSDLELLYALNLDGPQNLVVSSRSLTRPDIRAHVNEEFYQLVEAEGESLAEVVASAIANPVLHPILVEYGTAAMADIAEMGCLDVAVLSEYRGPLPESSIGSPYETATVLKGMR